MIVKFNVSVFKHPDAFNDVFVYVPLALYVAPFAPHEYESHEDALIDDDELLLIVKFNVAVFTQPAAFNDVEVYAPLALYETPFADHVYESQAVCVEDDVELLLIVKFNVAVFKQPAAFNDVYVYVPPALYVTPFAAHVYESHDVCVNDDDVLLLIVKFNVAVFTQPAAFNDVYVYVPDAVYVTLFAAHVYESQAVSVEDDDVLLLIVKFNVAVFTQPAAFNDVYVYVPPAVYVTPFAAHVYESHEEALIDDDELLLTVKFNVAVFKQPEAFNDVYVYVPPAVYVAPFAAHVYESQAVCVEDEEVLLLIVKFNVAVFTQPEAFNDVFVYVPPAVYVTPFAAQV